MDNLSNLATSMTPETQIVTRVNKASLGSIALSSEASTKVSDAVISIEIENVS